MFKVKILTSKGTLYDGQASSVFCPADTGEFEVLRFHHPIISVLKKGDIIIDWKKKVMITKGIMRMINDEFIALVEE